MKRLSSLASRAEFLRFASFLAVGGLNTFVGYSLFAGILLLGASAPLAAVGSTVLGVMFNFHSVGRIVFASSNHRLLPRFIGVYVAQYAVNVASLTLLARAGISPLIGQALVAPFLAVLTFLLLRRYVFTGPAESLELAP